MVADRLTLTRRRCPTAVHVQLPASGGRVQGGVEDVIQLRSQPRILDLSHHLDSSIEITMHHVGAPDPELVDGAEMNNSRVLEKAAQNRAHRDVFGESGHTWTQRADAPDDDIDADACLRRSIERIDHLLVDQRVGLESDAGVSAGLLGGDLTFDPLDDSPTDK